jgi:hypothetical protein
MMVRPNIHWYPRLILGAETCFRLSRDIADNCRMLGPIGHAYDVLVRFFSYWVYTDLNHHDTLGYE